jgi:hypothetical protein
MVQTLAPLSVNRLEGIGHKKAVFAGVFGEETPAIGNSILTHRGE